MKIEKNKYIRINDFCIIGYSDIFRTDNDEYKYVIGIKSHQFLDENEFEIFGYGDDFESCMLHALDIISSKVQNSISFESLFDLNIKELGQLIENRKGDIESPNLIYVKEECDAGLGDWNISLQIEGDDLCTLAQ